MLEDTIKEWAAVQKKERVGEWERGAREGGYGVHKGRWGGNPLKEMPVDVECITPISIVLLREEERERKRERERKKY